MAWVRFTDVFRWAPTPQVTVYYQKGQTRNVTRACADAAISTGKAIRMRKPARDKAPVRED